ncbi:MULTISPECIES: helix-turn-helix transcriptional regulator [Glycomyces]|uniref:DNA-binding transcriptional regulator YafY n=2 Tax=Glycomyces TaxID=58113 RepID=A0A9X3PJE0_9ACTN|nr:WYL domain-containing protein [Glycomyces lechevalierae]MDA1386601.1 WYL domain-containing protein [Glycomyces lechevalierae]MDR7340667.1 putative DNA-binding transcriptional regulator YafY [Glycomyces lechevalierae]
MTPDRFSALLLALQSRPETTVAALADETGVSARTVIRDLNWLRDAGFPVLMRRGKYGGVFMLPGGTLDAARLTPHEREHLTLTGLDEEQRRRLGVEPVTGRALRKVAGSRPSEDLLPIGDLVVSDNRPWFGREPHGVTPAQLIGDLRRGVRLRVEYRRPGEPAARRTVDPYGLLAKGGRWYLVADESGKPRLLNLQRIAGWEPLRAVRRLRPGARLTTVAAELTSGWEDKGDLTFHLLIEDSQAARAERILGSRLSIVGSDGQGRTEGILRCRELEDVRQLLPFADTVTVTDPPEARRRIRKLAHQILNHYASAD